MASAAEIAVNIVTKLDDSGIRDAESRMGRFSSAAAKAGKVAAVGLAAVGVAAFGAAKAAAEDEAAQAQLAKTLQNSANASSSQIAANEEWIASMSRATGVADDELRPALGSLVRATGDVELSQKALKTAMDVSAATGKPLQSVADAMAKGFAGTTTSLGRLVPGLDKAALASGDMNKIMDELGKKTGGAAAEAAETTAGKFKIFQVQVGELQEELGAALLPVLSETAGILSQVADYAAENTTTVKILIGVVVALMAAVVAVNAVLKVWGALTKAATAAQWLWNAAMAANPILLIVLAVAALGVALVIAWKKSETFRRIVLGVWDAVKRAALAVWKWLKSAWTTIWKVLQVPIKAYAAYVKFVFNLIRTIISGAIKVIKAVIGAVWAWVKSATRDVSSAIIGFWRGVASAVRDILRTIQDIFRSVWNWIGDAAANVRDKVLDVFQSLADKLRGIWDGIMGVITDALNTAIAAINKLINAANKLPGVNIPTVPTGLSAPAPATAGFAAPRVRGASTRAAVAGGTTVINVNGALDPEAVARQIQRILGGHTRRIGLAVT